MTDRSILPDDDAFDEAEAMADFDRFMHRMMAIFIVAFVVSVGGIVGLYLAGRLV